jgi:predicted Zn-dependent peptidase
VPNLTSPDTASAGVAEELAKLADLRERSILSDEEFAAAKARLLAH